MIAAMPGPLVAIGGAEDKSGSVDILRRVLDLTGVEQPAVGVVTTASAIPDQVFDGYFEAFTAIGAGDIGHIRIRDRADADRPDFVAMIGDRDVLFISGGDQMRLTSILGGSMALDAIRLRWQTGGAIAGTSAGAACQATTMIYGGPADGALRKGAVKMTAGFGFAPGVIIDTHFVERGRLFRLMEVGAANPGQLGVGLGEDAAVLFAPDGIHAFGPGQVIVIDSSEMTDSNVFYLDDGDPVAVDNIRMHALIDGYGFNLAQRRVIRPGEAGFERQPGCHAERHDLEADAGAPVP